MIVGYHHRAALAQLVMRSIRNRKIAGSNPAGGTTLFDFLI